MDFTNGVYKIVQIYVNGAYVPIGCLTSNSFSESSEMLETTTRENAEGWKTSIPTKQSYTISLSGLLTNNNRSETILTYRDLQTLKRDKIKFSWKISTDDPSIADFGSGYITSLSNNAEIDSFIDFTAEIEGYGKPYQEISEVDFLNYTLNVTI